VPIISGITQTPTSDELKHFGAAMASHGSTPLFHLDGITPEATSLASRCRDGNMPSTIISNRDFDVFFSKHQGNGTKIDLVVFSAPQLSIFELKTLADLLSNVAVSKDTTLLAVTSPQVAADAARMGITKRIESAGGLVLQGMCFYQSYAREMAELNGWKTLMTNSVKLTNIISGYGYTPFLGTMSACVASAVAGEVLVGS